MTSVVLKEKAIALRNRGLTYSEIQKEVPVSKSLLSTWLRDIVLDPAVATIMEIRGFRRLAMAREKAALTLHEKRAIRNNLLKQMASGSFRIYQAEPFFMLGLGVLSSFIRKDQPSMRLKISDVSMAKTLLLWLRKYPQLSTSEVKVTINGSNTGEFAEMLVGLGEMFRVKPVGSTKESLEIKVFHQDALRKIRTWQKLALGRA